MRISDLADIGKHVTPVTLWLLLMPFFKRWRDKREYSLKYLSAHWVGGPSGAWSSPLPSMPLGQPQPATSPVGSQCGPRRCETQECGTDSPNTVFLCPVELLKSAWRISVISSPVCIGFLVSHYLLPQDTGILRSTPWNILGSSHTPFTCILYEQPNFPFILRMNYPNHYSNVLFYSWFSGMRCS